MDFITNDIKDLYSVLQIDKSATTQQIKKAYRKLALCYHPDRLSSQPNLKESHLEQAKHKFQQISASYAILSDESSRRRYDQTGRIDSFPGLASSGDQDSVYDYFANLYDSCISPEAIEEFRKGYQGSEDEQMDIYAAYTKHHGDMDLILSEIPCSSVDDEDRFRTLIDTGISKKILTSYKKYTHEPKKNKMKRKRQAEREAVQAEALAQELGIRPSSCKKLKAQEENNLLSLQMLIANKQTKRANQFDDMISRLEQKHVPPPSKKSKKTPKQSNNNTKPELTSPPVKQVEESNTTKSDGLISYESSEDCSTDESDDFSCISAADGSDENEDSDDESYVDDLDKVYEEINIPSDCFEEPESDYGDYIEYLGDELGCQPK